MEELDTITIHKARDGDRTAWRTLYNHYSPLIWKSMFRTVNGDQLMAQELTQEAFIKAFRHLENFKGESTLSTWLYRIAYTTAMSRLKQAWAAKKRTAPLNEEVHGQEAVAEKRLHEHDLVTRLLAPLSAAERFLLVNREVHGMSYDELAAISGDSAGTLRTRLHRLKESLRKGLSDERP